MYILELVQSLSQGPWTAGGALDGPGFLIHRETKRSRQKILKDYASSLDIPAWNVAIISEEVRQWRGKRGPVVFIEFLYTPEASDLLSDSGLAKFGGAERMWSVPCEAFKEVADDLASVFTAIIVSSEPCLFMTTREPLPPPPPAFDLLPDIQVATASDIEAALIAVRPGDRFRFETMAVNDGTRFIPWPASELRTRYPFLILRIAADAAFLRFAVYSPVERRIMAVTFSARDRTTTQMIAIYREAVTLLKKPVLHTEQDAG